MLYLICGKSGKRKPVAKNTLKLQLKKLGSATFQLYPYEDAWDQYDCMLVRGMSTDEHVLFQKTITAFMPQIKNTECWIQATNTNPVSVDCPIQSKTKENQRSHTYKIELHVSHVEIQSIFAYFLSAFTVDKFKIKCVYVNIDLSQNSTTVYLLLEKRYSVPKFIDTLLQYESFIDETIKLKLSLSLRDEKIAQISPTKSITEHSSDNTSMWWYCVFGYTSNTTRDCSNMKAVIWACTFKNEIALSSPNEFDSICIFNMPLIQNDCLFTKFNVKTVLISYKGNMAFFYVSFRKLGGMRISFSAFMQHAETNLNKSKISQIDIFAESSKIVCDKDPNFKHALVQITNCPSFVYKCDS
jgi:hypothetical protein